MGYMCFSEEAAIVFYKVLTLVVAALSAFSEVKAQL
jgi:hypothetical protein